MAAKAYKKEVQEVVVEAEDEVSFEDISDGLEATSQD